MLAALINAFRVADLRKKILYTAFLLFIYRLGSFIPVPGVDAGRVMAEFERAAGTAGAGFLSLLDMFAGGALSRFTVFALNVGPYITASIVLNLLQVVIPSLDELAKEGVEGRKKIAQYTRYLTIVLAVINAYAYMLMLSGAIHPGIMNRFLIIVSMTAGTAFVMWLGEKISENGVGNGISLIIFAGIVARIPSGIERTFKLIAAGGTNIIVTLIFAVLGVGLIAAVVAVTEGQRRIPVQYPKRVVGRRVYGGQSTHIPLRVNQAGVIPVIFASSVLAFPATLAQFVPAIAAFTNSVLYRSWVYNIIYVTLIVVFTFFYTGITFNPLEVANNMRKYGGFIPGFRPGRPTAEYLDRVLTRITLAGAIFLAGIAVMPNLTSQVTTMNIAFGGTGLLIVVGVALDTMKQIESQLLMRQYEGFLK